jgi:hypothetical protein
LWTRHVRSLAEFRGSGAEAGEVDVEGRLAESRIRLKHVSSPEYLNELRGTIGADPMDGF